VRRDGANPRQHRRLSKTSCAPPRAAMVRRVPSSRPVDDIDRDGREPAGALMSDRRKVETELWPARIKFDAP